MAKAEAKPVAEAFLDKKKLLDKVPLIARPVFAPLIDWLNKLDLDGDGVPDLLKYGPRFIEATPLIIELAKHIDWSQVIAFFAKDKAKAAGALKNLLTALEDEPAVLVAEVEAPDAQKAAEGVA
jgi:hypothetical protein